MEKRKTPKEDFLMKFHSVLSEFEAITGVEIHAIRIERVRIDDIIELAEKTITYKYDLELK